jgi:hypothetical protein
MGRPASRHQIEWAASGLRRAAADIGVPLPVDYSQAVAADGLARSPELGVTRLGAGAVIHTQPASSRELPVVIGYADPRGQWYRDGHRHTTAPALDVAPEAVSEEVAL